MTEALKTTVTVSVNLNGTYVKHYNPYSRDNGDGSFTTMYPSAEFDRFDILVQQLPEREGRTVRYE